MSFVRPDTVFLDLGANVGIFSLQVARRVMTLGKVHAFEPQIRLAGLLRRSAVLNGLAEARGAATIEIHAVGVSDRKQPMGFVIPEGHLGGGRVIEAMADRSVIVVRLDDYFGADFCCDLVKIDVEGHELPALRGMEKILANSTRVKVLFEKLGRNQGSEKGIERFLDKLGFSLYGVTPPATLVPFKAGDLAQWDGYALAAKNGDPDLQELIRARFCIYPSQLALGSAIVEDGILKCEGAVGQVAFHGPYWFLPRGMYRIRLHGELKGDLIVTIATRFGYPLTTCKFADAATSIDFCVERDAVLFECVARLAAEKTALSLQKIDGRSTLSSALLRIRRPPFAGCPARRKPSPLNRGADCERSRRDAIERALDLMDPAKRRSPEDFRAPRSRTSGSSTSG